MKVKFDFGLLLKHSRPKKKPFLLYIVALRRILDKILCSYNIFNLTNYETYYISIYMAAQFHPYRYFSYPQSPGQKQYEANAVFFESVLLSIIFFDSYFQKISLHHGIDTWFRLYDGGYTKQPARSYFMGDRFFVKVQRGLCHLLTDIRLRICELALT